MANFRSETLRNSDENLLYQIWKQLDKLQNSISNGFQGNGGWTDDGTTIKLTTSTDKVGIGTATPTHKLTVVGDDTTILDISGTVNTGKTSGIETNGDVLGLGLYEGTGIYYTDGTATSIMLATEEGGDPKIAFQADDGVNSNSAIDVKINQVSINNNTDGGSVSVRFRVNDPDGIRMQGKDTGSTNYALRVYDGNSSAFGGSELFAVRNDGLVAINGLSGSGNGVVAVNNDGELSWSAGATGFTIDDDGNMYAGTGAVVTSNFNLVAGINAAADGQTIAIGYEALGGNNSIVIGATAQELIGSSIVLGNAAQSTASNQFIVGGNPFISETYIGDGVTSGVPPNTSINATGGEGTNIAGANLTIAAGKGTGNSTSGGYISLSTSNAGSSGSTLQTLSEKVRVTKTGDVVVLDSANGIVLKDAAGTPHYWRITVSTLGALTTTDLGTSIPT